MKTIQCPSCGASATNLQNCEFCGSFFVRAYKLKVDSSSIVNYFYFEQIANALKLNLEIQINNVRISDIKWNNYSTYIYLNKTEFLNNKTESLKVINSHYISDAFIIEPSIPSIAVDIYSEFFTNAERKKFLKLEESKFFSTYQEEGYDTFGYVIDFGNDYIGAAKFISKILIEIKGIGQSTNIFCVTEPGGWYNEDYIKFITNNYDLEVQAFIKDRIKHTKNQNKSVESYCFIATATMGDYDHSQVIELRNFRDNWILEKSWGDSFVKWYYQYGSIVAKYIESSFLLKKISYFFIVKPLVYLARMLKNSI
jgi:hypothetical protein